MKKKTHELFDIIRVRFPTYENECYAKRTRILRTTVLASSLRLIFRLAFTILGHSFFVCSHALFIT